MSPTPIYDAAKAEHDARKTTKTTKTTKATAKGGKR
jgi:hypothetical protein